MLEDDFFESSEVGISIYNLSTGESLYTYRDKKLTRPASVLKLLTATAALTYPEFEKPFRTELYYKGTLESDTLYGDLYVVGGFDPEFDEDSMQGLVEALQELPVTYITGTLYGDVSMKDSLYWGPGWSWDDTPYYFQPYLSPLMFHKGYVTVQVRPGEPGEQAALRFTPNSTFYSVENLTRTRNEAAGKFSLTRNWLENRNDIVVRGNVTAPVSSRINLYKSEDFFLCYFRERLLETGIDIRDTGYKEMVTDSVTAHIATWETPVRKVLAQMMKKSDNVAAEAVYFRLAALFKEEKRVGFEEGADAVKEFISSRLELDPENYRIADGSGISLYNYITPELLMECLKFAYADIHIFQELYKALPIAGIDGTLQNRMKTGKAYKNVHAKTGSVTGINSLAGFIRSVNNNDLAFVIINQNVRESKKARLFQDKICEILCNYAGSAP
ncbi:MAG: D-alanyl-D-alanine carboxypeptidase/D-alanyl-D-alanine-endopeptidase [Bacteroides sp.]|nr:D-alanyl-D-alanine carboxypeptidase/D-alanyl-D-alanine-endopeptidase [Bacteroides sp.]